MQSLHEAAGGRAAVWAVGQAGHVQPPGATLTAADVCKLPQKYCLLTKFEFISMYLLYLILVILITYDCQIKMLPSIACWLALH